MVFATPSRAKPEPAWQSETCLQCCIRIQRGMPKWQATSRAWSTAWFDWNVFRFRSRPVALTADIESMFLQVQAPEQDRSCLRFLWRVYSIAVDTQFHRKQQMFVANRVAETLDTTDVSQWKRVSGMNNPADIGTRAINIEELKRSEWLIGPAWLRRPKSKWPEHVNLVFASDEENIPSSSWHRLMKRKRLFSGNDSVILAD